MVRSLVHHRDDAFVPAEPPPVTPEWAITSIPYYCPAPNRLRAYVLVRARELLLAAIGDSADQTRFTSLDVGVRVAKCSACQAALPLTCLWCGGDDAACAAAVTCRQCSTVGDACGGGCSRQLNEWRTVDDATARALVSCCRTQFVDVQQHPYDFSNVTVLCQDTLHTLPRSQTMTIQGGRVLFFPSKAKMESNGCATGVCMPVCLLPPAVGLVAVIV
jgi:hypothetical protein